MIIRTASSIVLKRQTMMMLTRRAIGHTRSLGARRCLCTAADERARTHCRATIASNSGSGGSSSSNSPTATRYMATTTTSATKTSVSSAEVHKFNEMHRDWWDPAKNVLIPMNMVRVQYIQTICQQHFANNHKLLQHQQKRQPQLPLQGLRALDIGCGGGLLSESLARLGATVTGLDPSPQLLAAAQQHAALDRFTRNNIQYRNGTAEELAAAEHEQQQNKLPYDVVCLLEVMEHATNVPSLLQAASSLLHPDHGILFVSTINRTLKSYALTIVGAEYLLRYIPVGTHHWKQYRSPQEFAVQAKESANLEEMDVQGMVLERLPLFSIMNPTWDWKLDPSDTDVNWIGAYRKSKTKAEA